MKKIFAILLALTLLASLAVPVMAEPTPVEAPWEKFMGDTTVTTSTEDGATVYSFSNITNTYISAGVDIMPALKTLIEGNDKITVTISMDVKIDYNADFDGDEFPLGVLIRAGGVNAKIKDPEAFKAIYKSAQAGDFYDTGSGNYALRFIEKEVAIDTWSTIEGEATFTATDIKAGLWEKLTLCFDRMSNCEACKTMYIKNTTIEVTDYEEGDGEIVVDLEQAVETPEDSVDTTSLDLTANGDAEDTPALPEGNLLDTKWAKGYNATDVVEGTFKDQPMYSMTQWKNAYSSPFLDILPAVKAAMGEEEEITVYIVMDLRVLNYKGMEGASHPFGIKIRPKTTELTTEKEDFDENYLGATFTHNGKGDVRLTLLGSDKKEITEEWQRFEFIYTFFAEDVEDGLWAAWNLCFDNVKNFKTLGAIQAKNMGVFLEDNYEPINVEPEATPVPETSGDANTDKPVSDGTVEPIVLHNPIGGGRYQITFMEAVDTEVEGGLIGNNGGNDLTAIIAAAVGAVVIIGALVTVVVLKKKNSVKEEEK